MTTETEHPDVASLRLAVNAALERQEELMRERTAEINAVYAKYREPISAAVDDVIEASSLFAARLDADKLK